MVLKFAGAMPLGEVAGASAPDERFASLALGALVEYAAPRRDCCVLDLGPGIGANVEFLSAFSSRMCIEDLYQTLFAIGHPFSGEARTYCPVYEMLLPYQGQTPFDLILLWNMLDYLDKDDIRRLSAYLGRLSKRGTLMYALVSTRRTIPATPPTYKILDGGNLCGRSTSTAQAECPRHSQVRLVEWMRGWRVKRSYLLRNGMQEYVFEV